jgi:hypothetical protein
MSKRARSPVLGYNHNLRYGGRVFHVQTEDSGQSYARLYTHLFFEGTILSSKKEQYDPESPEDAVRALMQKLHKAMIRELTRGEHDPRIGAFFTARGEPAMLEPRPAVAEPAATVAEAAPVEAKPTAAPASATVANPKVAAKPVVIVQPAALKRSPVAVSNPADGVVVRRNVVIDVGAGQPPVQGTPASATAAAGARAKPATPAVARDGSGFVAGTRARPSPAAEASPHQPLASAREIRMPWETPASRRPTQVAAATSGAVDHVPPSATGKIRMPWDPPGKGAEGFVSDKSLDEVILEYLADDQDSGG